MSMHPGRDLSAAPNVPPPLLLPSQLPAAPTTALGGVDGEQLWLWGMDGLVWRIQGPRRGGHVVEGRPVPRWVGEQGVNGGPHGFPERAQSLDMERESGWRVLPFGLLRSASLGQVGGVVGRGGVWSGHRQGQLSGLLCQSHRGIVFLGRGGTSDIWKPS